MRLSRSPSSSKRSARLDPVSRTPRRRSTPRPEAMVAKDGELTFDEAVCKVLDDNPELYEKYEDERQKTVKRRGK